MASPTRVIFLVAANGVTSRVRNHPFGFGKNATVRCAKRKHFVCACAFGVSRRV